MASHRWSPRGGRHCRSQGRCRRSLRLRRFGSGDGRLGCGGLSFDDALGWHPRNSASACLLDIFDNGSERDVRLCSNEQRDPLPVGDENGSPMLRHGCRKNLLRAAPSNHARTAATPCIGDHDSSWQRHHQQLEPAQCGITCGLHVALGRATHGEGLTLDEACCCLADFNSHLGGSCWALQKLATQRPFQQLRSQCRGKAGPEARCPRGGLVRGIRVFIQEHFLQLLQLPRDLELPRSTTGRQRGSHRRGGAAQHRRRAA
mmetsp:Transcript_45364/g.105936  ORF Transcript_45364/g.105936 Transcript_45364/m.105936 type:complete len:260 (-) Transcript_45364:66-845(-)